MVNKTGNSNSEIVVVISLFIQVILDFQYGLENTIDDSNISAVEMNDQNVAEEITGDKEIPNQTEEPGCSHKQNVDEINVPKGKFGIYTEYKYVRNKC